MIDIERWLPQRWDQVLANKAIKDYFHDMIWCVRKEGHRSGFNLLATGASRTGKTSAITFGIKCLGCLHFDFDTMNPCGVCKNCSFDHHLLGNDGWEDWIDYLPENEASTPIRYHVQIVDCTRLGQSDLDHILSRLRIRDDSVKIVYPG